MMRDAAKILRGSAGEYARLMAQEMGKPVRDGVAEVEKCASGCDFYAENAARFLAREPILTEARNRNGRLHGVIIEAASLISACIGVADNALDKGTSFAGGHELAAARSARIPPGYVGMMLSRKEAAAMLDRIEGD